MTQQFKKGDKVIFKNYGCTISANKGYVYTFHRYYKEKGTPNNCFFQVKELLDNKQHNFLIADVELFNPEIHKDYTIVTSEVLSNDYNEFVKNYGA